MIKSFAFSVSIAILFSCHPTESNDFSPAFKSYFTQKLKSADSSIEVKSFKFLNMDTLYEKWAINRQRFPYLQSLANINGKLNILSQKKPTTTDSIENKARQIKQLLDEKNILSKELDSLNIKLETADSLLPVGYMARFQYSIRMHNGSLKTDTIGYALDKNMRMIDWDDNNEKSIDAIINGNRPVLR